MDFILPLVSLLSLAALIFTLKKHPLFEQNVPLLALYLLAVLFWNLSLLLSQLPAPPWLSAATQAQLPNYGALLLALLFFQLTRRFIRQDRKDWIFWLLGIAWISGCALLVENWLNFPETLWVVGGAALTRTQAAALLQVAGWALPAGASALLVLQAYRLTPSPLHRNRLKYWSLLALALTVAGGSGFLAGYPQAGSPVYLLGAWLAAWLMPVHHLPDVRQIMRRSLAGTTALLLSILLYGAAFYGGQLLLLHLPGYNPLAFSAALALALVLALNPLIAWLQGKIRRRAAAGYDPGQILQQYARQISNILDLPTLAGAVAGQIDGVFHPRSLALWIVLPEPAPDDQSTGAFRLRAVAGPLESTAHEAVLSAGSALLARLSSSAEPLTQYDIDLLPEFRSIPAEERSWFAGLNVDIYVPITVRSRWIGLLALGARQSGDRYDQRDHRLLRALAVQTGVVLENAHLYDDLKARNADNERLNRELLSANRELERLDQAKSDFINIASHELRTPLTQVRGYNEILAEMMAGSDFRPETGLGLTRNVRKATLKLEEIVDTMFDVSRLDSQTLQLEKYSTSVSGIIHQALDVWTQALSIRRQEVQLEPLESLPPIYADSSRMKQAFSNLIQNAIKYTPDGGQITISGRLLEGENGSERAVEVVVADTGIGVAPDDAERIFEKFYRVGNTLLHSSGEIKFKGGGPGLGLPVARGIIAAHGGRIWVESPGYDEKACPGSRFHVLLPLEK